MAARVPLDSRRRGMRSQGWFRRDGFDFPAVDTPELRCRTGEKMPLVAVDAQKCAVFCIATGHSAGYRPGRGLFPVAIGRLAGAVSPRGASVHHRSRR